MRTRKLVYTDRTCPYCLEIFSSCFWNKKFCCTEHRNKYERIKYGSKDPVVAKLRLSKDDFLIWKRIVKELSR